MAFQVSPGVQVNEIDLTNVVPAVSTTTGAFAGSFQWGPVDEVITVSDSKGLVDTFGTPANTNAGAEDFYTAESFLKYGSSLRVVRVNSTGLFNAHTSGGSGDYLVRHHDDYTNNVSAGGQAATVGKFVARFAGSKGNSLKISTCASANAYFNDTVTTAGANEAIGQTTITVAASNVFTIRDIITFPQTHSTQYRVLSAPSGTTITIEALDQPAGTGLTHAVDSGHNIDRYWEHYGLFAKAPGKSASATAAGGSNDEIHIVVTDEDGSWTGTAHTVLETFGFLSLASDAKDSTGGSNYYKKVLEDKSEYVYWGSHSTGTHAGAAVEKSHADSVGTPFGAPSGPEVASFARGADGRTGTAGQKQSAWSDHFEDANSLDFSFLIVGSTRTDDGSGADQDIPADWTTQVNQAILLAEKRKDCMVVASPRRTSVVGVSSESTQTTNVLADCNTATSSSFAVLDSNWVYQYDRFNDKYCWIPANGHTAGIMARSDLMRDAWVSPAGFSRGQYLGITKIAYNPKQASRDDLYRARVNPVVTFPGQGTILFGDKTALTSPSAFDRINVRRLFIVLEKAISTAAQAQLFEYNDAFTRAQFRAAIEPFLRDVKNRRGLVDFSVVCDETNNTDSVMDRNEFVCSIFVKPARSINYITLNFVAARSGVQFEEIYSAV